MANCSQKPLKFYMRYILNKLVAGRHALKAKCVRKNFIFKILKKQSETRQHLY